MRAIGAFITTERRAEGEGTKIVIQTWDLPITGHGC